MKRNKIGIFNRQSRKSSSYKSDDARINAIYRANKKLIDEKLKSHGPAKFRNLVKANMKVDNKTIDQAVRSIGRSRTFTTYTEQLEANIKKSISKEVSLDIRRKIAKAKGGDWRNAKFNIRDFKWNPETKSYINNDLQLQMVFNYPDDSESESIISVMEL